jgi:hypothetical protein
MVREKETAKELSQPVSSIMHGWFLVDMVLVSIAVIPLWMWALTPLTSAALGAWLIGTGTTLA